MKASAGRGLAVMAGVWVALAAGCGRDGADPGSAASARRVGEIAAQVEAELAALKKNGCTDPAAQRAKGLASELAERHAASGRTRELLAAIMRSACPGVQAETVVALRRLRPMVEGKVPDGELVDALTAGLGATDGTVRTLSAMTVYELRIDPRGTRLAELLKGVATGDVDEKARATASWVVERVNAAFPAK